MRFFICLAMMIFATGSVASGQRGASAAEIRDAVQWASEEPGHAAARYMPGIDYSVVVRRCLARDRSSFRSLFTLSVHTDAAASDLQAGILAIVLKQVGDDFFATQLEKVSNAARLASIALLKDELLTQSPPPYGIRLSDYPKIMRLLQRSNGAVE